MTTIYKYPVKRSLYAKVAVVYNYGQPQDARYLRCYVWKARGRDNGDTNESDRCEHNTATLLDDLCAETMCVFGAKCDVTITILLTME